MNSYSHEELVDMLTLYRVADRNRPTARQLYQEPCPNRRVPHHTIFASVNRGRESGSGHMKSLVYETSVPSIEDIITRKSVASKRIYDQPRIFQNIRYSMQHQFQASQATSGCTF
ncbi:hypothetical protein TNCV_4929381 [Trichonephila clavipes]|nr:hypothetical protein TNCV_4929381 [Trichonephila clavipes]